MPRTQQSHAEQERQRPPREPSHRSPALVACDSRVLARERTPSRVGPPRDHDATGHTQPCRKLDLFGVRRAGRRDRRASVRAPDRRPVARAMAGVDPLGMAGDPRLATATSRPSTSWTAGQRQTCSPRAICSYESSTSPSTIGPAVPPAAGARRASRRRRPAADGEALSPGRHRAGRASGRPRRHRSRDGAHRRRARPPSSSIRITRHRVYRSPGAARMLLGPAIARSSALGWFEISPPRFPSTADGRSRMRAAGPGRELPLGRIAAQRWGPAESLPLPSRCPESLPGARRRAAPASPTPLHRRRMNITGAR
jgi:hypothetical protein